MDSAPQQKEAEPAGAQSVDRALGLLSSIARAGGSAVSINYLLEQSGLSRPTVRRMLLALIRAGLVEQDADSRSYALGPESYVIGLMANRRFDLLDLAIDSLMALARDSEDTCFLSIRRGAYSVCLHREDGPFPIRTHALQAGQSHPLGVGAGAMAILAALPDAQVEEVIADTAQALATGYPGYTPDLLREHVEETRARGWSANPGLYLPNSWAVGIAIIGPGGEPIGALSVAALDTRMQPERQHQIADLLKREKRSVEAKLNRKLAFKNPSTA
ncbi:IclR family transcriptional regulator [Roseibium sp. CAU 1637]|uniref:IclR family transcriptional regulator n=1 Tax=Roseibium limicola TaxID=2816037 RepID=A0A939ES29_9HYPH|nr:IclR family transcriptional regulator [Roseibium limicola]MBO0347458.1 IclR family transcriptional regulator [Roseibium limicola]